MLLPSWVRRLGGMVGNYTGNSATLWREHCQGRAERDFTARGRRLEHDLRGQEGLSGRTDVNAET